ncbi:MAG TPA: CHAD domain-containing protein [Rhizomicrobium sp.]|nr:CHAD domain-containing protein [Rhizomicrobium sp.]
MGQQFEFKLGERALKRLPQGFLPIVLDPMPQGPHPAPVKAKPAILPRDIPAEDAFRLTLLQCKWHIASNIAPMLEGHEVEGLHQMRVGFRRLRVALTSFGGDFRTPALEQLRDRAKRLSEKLGPARDLDVFVDSILAAAAEANPDVEGLDLLRERAGEARRTAWDFAIAHVQSPGFEAFLKDLGDAIDRRIWFEAAGRAHAASGHMAFEMRAADLAARMLDHRLKSARKKARHLRKLSAHKRHKLRIALKKLRYTSEFFAPLFEEHSARAFLAHLSKMQDVLGALNDVTVARQTLSQLASPRVGAHPSLSFAAGMVYGWHHDRAGHVWKGARKRWKKFEKTEPFWHGAD